MRRQRCISGLAALPPMTFPGCWSISSQQPIPALRLPTPIRLRILRQNTLRLFGLKRFGLLHLASISITAKRRFLFFSGSHAFSVVPLRLPLPLLVRRGPRSGAVAILTPFLQDPRRIQSLQTFTPVTVRPRIPCAHSLAQHPRLKRRTFGQVLVRQRYPRSWIACAARRLPPLKLRTIHALRAAQPDASPLFGLRRLQSFLLPDPLIPLERLFELFCRHYARVLPRDFPVRPLQRTIIAIPATRPDALHWITGALFNRIAGPGVMLRYACLRFTRPDPRIGLAIQYLIANVSPEILLPVQFAGIGTIIGIGLEQAKLVLAAQFPPGIGRDRDFSIVTGLLLFIQIFITLSDFISIAVIGTSSFPAGPIAILRVTARKKLPGERGETGTGRLAVRYACEGVPPLGVMFLG